MLSNPDMLRQMMENPMVSQLMSNPEVLRQLITSNPQMRELMEVRKFRFYIPVLEILNYFNKKLCRFS